LKSLDIQKVIVARYVLEKVIVSCPLLERMSLWDLKRSTHLDIDAPNLQFLKVGGGFRGFKLKNTPNLVGLKVKSFHGVKAEVDLLKVLLLSCPALQELEILVSGILLKHANLSLYVLNKKNSLNYLLL
jgi:hypothetical protein